MLENHALKLSHIPEKNHLAFCHVSCNVSLALPHKSWAFCEALSWKFATHCEAFSGRTAHATPLTVFLVTSVAHVAIFSTAQAVHWTTDSHAVVVVDAASHITFAVVATVHWTTALPPSTTQPADVALLKVSETQDFKSCHTHFTPSTVSCHDSFKVSPHCWTVDLIESTHREAVAFTQSTQAWPTHFTFSTHVSAAFFTASLLSSIKDESLFSAGAVGSATGAGLSAKSDCSQSVCGSGFSLPEVSVAGAILFSDTGSATGWLVAASVTGVVVLASCAGVTGVPTFCSSCVCVIINV